MKAFVFCVLTCCAAAHAATLGTYSGTVPVTNVVLFTGVNLADVRSASANIGGAMSCDGEFPPATPYHFANDGSVLTVQFQCYLGDFTKCVKLRLEQDGDDIVGRSFYTAYVNDRYRDYEGTDADGAPWGNRTEGGTGYQIKNLVLSDEDDAYLRTSLWWNGADGVANPMSATAGIGEALITTAAGLIASLVLLFPYNVLDSKVEED